MLQQFPKKDEAFKWIEDCEKVFAILKYKMVNAMILEFLDYLKEFHVCVDASSISPGVVLA